MNTRDDMIRSITDGLGNDATRDDGEAVFDYLKQTGDIQWVAREGYVMSPAVDLLRAYDNAVNGWDEDDSLVDCQVEAGTGEDHDTGRVMRYITPTSVMVAWDSGVQTPADVSALRVL